MRMRLDIADHMIEVAENGGIDMLTKENAQPIGDIVNSMTGRGKFRGNLAPMEQASGITNVFFYSIRFLKSNIDVLTAPPKYVWMKTLGKKAGFEYTQGEAFARYQAAKNTMSIVAGLTSVYIIANMMLGDDAVDWDPRGANFGKIKIGNRLYDPSGGMAGLVRIASRMMPTLHNGDLAFWTKDKNGRYKKTTDIIMTNKGPRTKGGGYYSTTAYDVWQNYLSYKASPFIGAISDILKGELYSGRDVTIPNVAIERGAPINLQTIWELKDAEAGDKLFGILTSTLGIGSNEVK